MCQNPNLNQLVQQSFQGVNRLFVLAFENDAQRISKKRYYIPNVEIKDYNVMIDEKNFFDQPVKTDNLPKIKDWTYVTNLDEYSAIGTHWVALYVRYTNVTYFDYFDIEHVPKENKAFTDRSLSITRNIFRIQAYDSIMCRYFCIGIIDFMLAEKTLTEFTNPFSPNNFKKNDNIILNYLMDNV